MHTLGAYRAGNRGEWEGEADQVASKLVTVHKFLVTLRTNTHALTALHLALYHQC